mgnify:FL=1
MRIKELVLKNHTCYNELSAKDSEAFEGFLKVQFSEDNTDFEAGDVVYFNKNLVHRIVPVSYYEF